MTKLAWLCAWFGTSYFLLAVAIIWGDVWLAARRLPTVSESVLALARDDGAIGLAICFFGLLPFGMLLGHLFWPEKGPAPLIPALIGAAMAILLGCLVGRLLFPQGG